MRKAWLLFLAFTALLAAPAAAKADPMIRFTGKEKLEITVHTDWPKVTVGVTPIRVIATNRGEARDVRFVFKEDTRGSVLTKTIRLDKNQTQRFSLPVSFDAPIAALKVFVGDESKPLYSRSVASLTRSNKGGRLPILKLLPNRSAESGTFRGSTDDVVAIEPSELPVSWKDYTGLGLMVIDARVFDQVPRDQLNEIWTWVAAGGQVLLFNVAAYGPEAVENLLPNGFAIDQMPLLFETAPGLRHQSYLLGDFYFYNGESLRGSVRVNDHGNFMDHIGVRECWKAVLQHSLGSSLTRLYRSPNFREVPSTYGGYSGPPDPPGERGGRSDELGVPITANVHDGFKVPGVGEPPMALFWLAILAFAVLIGPVNFLVLRRKRRQTLVIVTAPLLALGAIGVMAVSGILVDGLNTKGVIWSITILDMENKIAASQTQMFLFAGLSPGDGLVFDADATLLANSEREEWDEYRYRYDDNPPDPPPTCLIDSTHGDRFLSGWLPARTQVALATTAVVKARERIGFRRNADKTIRVTNSLGVPIKTLAVVDDDGVLYRSGPIDVGAEATLKPTDPWAMRTLNPKNGLNSALEALKMCRQFNGGAKLSKNAFFCTVPTSPFIRTGLDEIEQVAGKHIIAGKLVWEKTP